MLNRSGHCRVEEASYYARTIAAGQRASIAGWTERCSSNSGGDSVGGLQVLMSLSGQGSNAQIAAVLKWALTETPSIIYNYLMGNAEFLLDPNK